MNSDLAQQIDALLPQTQCTKCGFAGCLPYAQAIASQQAKINRCSPGGEATIQALANLLSVPYVALATDVEDSPPNSLAMIDEARCIGCTLCLKACPVDAILGARQLMHTVITDWCTGCGLCLSPCPVDCIRMQAHPTHQVPPAASNRERYYAHQQRTRSAEQASPLRTEPSDKQQAIQAALARKAKGA